MRIAARAVRANSIMVTTGFITGRLMICCGEGLLSGEGFQRARLELAVRRRLDPPRVLWYYCVCWLLSLVLFDHPFFRLPSLALEWTMTMHRPHSGHDLRLDDERLQSKRRRVVQASELSPPRPSAPSSGNKDNTPRVSDLKSDKGAPSLSGSEADMMDWRERIRQASQLPDDAGAGIESAVLGAEEVREEEARYGAVTDDGGGAGLP